MNEQGRNMDTQVTIDTSLGQHVDTTTGELLTSPAVRSALGRVIEAVTEQPAAEEELARIGTLRRELVRLELRLEDATEQLKGSRQWDLVQGLKEERKALQKKLDRAIDRTVLWAQPTMI
jgi:hypothetical protein